MYCHLDDRKLLLRKSLVYSILAYINRYICGSVGITEGYKIAAEEAGISISIYLVRGNCSRVGFVSR